MSSVQWCRAGLWLVVFSLLQACTKQRLYGDYAVAPLKYDLEARSYGQLVKALREGTKPLVPGECFGVDAPESFACEQKRNMVIGDLVAFSDELCEQHMKTIFGNEAAFNIATGTLTNVFSGAATVVGGAVAKSALSAAAFLSNSERSLVNETIYKSVLVPAVARKIEAIRTEKRDKIRGELERSHNAYPIHIALLDVIEYHRSCSFMLGLQRALEEGTRASPTPTPTPDPSEPTQ